MYSSASCKFTSKFSKYMRTGIKAIWLLSDNYDCHVKESYQNFSNDAFGETLINKLSNESLVNNDNDFQRFYKPGNLK